MKKSELAIAVLKTVVGTAVFALGLNLFLLPNELNHILLCHGNSFCFLV